MSRYLRMAALTAAILSAGSVSHAQLAAFPGAEGAGMLATGGRGGDVYHVINLDNTGAGSLRNGITTAPAGGRTIVFDVAGTIHLTSSLDISSKSKLTIAGQTAPAGGITIADHQTRINNSNNVVLQHIRLRPGSTFGSSDPDALSVTGSNNVMVDHVTASWGVDETISVTSSSNNVTVQWSTMTQGLYNAGHTDTDGVGHSYGSLINGGTYTYHHNLYAHSKSRHPRAQDDGAHNLRLDWVNNVMYNPGDRFGYSDNDDQYVMNIVGNYGIKGPQSNSNTALMRPETTLSHFYVEGNYTDLDRDLVLDGSAVNGSAVFAAGDLYTLDPARANIPAVTTDTAEQAYIQVLSRAGANNYRDSIDRRTIRTVFNHLPGQINTQADWGGWPTLPTGSPAADANADGVPDQWATDNGFSTATPLNSTFAPDGYTYLEKYVHSLTPNAFTPVGTVEHTVRTSYGNGADAFVTENGGGSAVSGGNGSGSSLDAGFTSNLNQAIVMRFDLSEIVPGSITDARLELTAASAITAPHDFMVYGLEHDNSRWNWDESTVQFNDAPGLTFDSNSSTLGISNTFSTTSHPDNAGVLTLGQFSIPSIGPGQGVSLPSPNLAVFLNLAAYYQGEASENVVTIILQQTNSNVSAASFYSKEGSADFAPRLVVDALLNPVAPPVYLGDFNGDFVVDAADYTVWRNNFGTNFDLGGNGDETGGSGGFVDEADYNLWMQYYGTVYVPPGGGGLADTPVPEPASVLLLLTGLLASFRWRRAV